jgi:hypothetical protein
MDEPKEPARVPNMEKLVPDWVKEMHAYRNEHGFYRIEDVFRVLGDPGTRVEIPASNLAAAAVAEGK